MLALAIATGSASTAATDPHHGQPLPAAPAASPVPDFGPAIDRLSGAVDEAHGSLAASTDALEAASAKVTFLLIGCGVVLVLLFGVLIAQVMILYRAIEVVRAETVTRNRPKLVIRQLDLEIFEPGKLAKVVWLAENIGNSPATVVEAHATLIILRRGGLPAIPQYDARNHAVGGLLLEPARIIPFAQFSHEEVAAAEYDAIFRSGTGGIFFYGYMLYVDEAAARRRIGFCRQYDPSSGRFVTIDDLNYEYAD